MFPTKPPRKIKNKKRTTLRRSELRGRRGRCRAAVDHACALLDLYDDEESCTPGSICITCA